MKQSCNPYPEYQEAQQDLDQAEDDLNQHLSVEAVDNLGRSN